jgi:FRG domain
MEQWLSTWQHFEKRLRVLERWRRRTTKPYNRIGRYWLYRGQANAKWPLTTTLERVGGADMPLTRYYEIISRIKPEIESLTRQYWDIPDPPTYNSLMSKAGGLPPIQDPAKLYEYVVYLRHHGFPSPLLDWTRSPYVAAYFAYKDDSLADDVAIYAYMEYARGGKLGDVGAPRIEGKGPFVRAHPRHHMQQAEYTICVRQTENGLVYTSHETVFQKAIEGQDVLCKFVLPGSERANVLEYCHRFNLNSYSLFGSEESLMEALKLRSFVMKV